MKVKVNLLLIALVLTFAALAAPATPDHAARVHTWWNLHIRGFRPDRSRRWDPLGQVRDLPGLVEEAKDRPLPPPPNLIPPIDTRMPHVPPATPVPLTVPGSP